MKTNRYITSRPLRGTSNRSTIKAEAIYDTLAKEKSDFCQQRLKDLGAGQGRVKSLGQLLRRQANSVPDGVWGFRDGGIDGGIDGGFGDVDDTDYDYESELDSNATDSEEEPEDDEMLIDLIQNPLHREQLKPARLKHSIKHKTKSSEYTLRSQKEVASWTELIAIVTGNVALHKQPHPCSCKKSTQSLPALSHNGFCNS